MKLQWPGGSVMLGVLVVTLPLLGALGWGHFWRKGAERDRVAVCEAFVAGEPGWQTPEKVAEQLAELEPEARGPFTAALARVTSTLGQPTPPYTLRLIAVPLQGRASFFREQQLVGPFIALDSKAPHSVKGAEVLLIDLPWQGGTFTALELQGPCGKYRQAFELFLDSDTRGVMRIRTFRGRQLMSQVRLQVQR